MNAFLGEMLPSLDYLEISAFNLTDETLQKCLGKFKQLTIFSSPDLEISRRQRLQTKYQIVSLQSIFARDFPAFPQTETLKSDSQID